MCILCCLAVLPSAVSYTVCQCSTVCCFRCTPPVLQSSTVRSLTLPMRSLLRAFLASNMLAVLPHCRYSLCALHCCSSPRTITPPLVKLPMLASLVLSLCILPAPSRLHSLYSPPQATLVYQEVYGRLDLKRKIKVNRQKLGCSGWVKLSRFVGCKDDSCRIGAVDLYGF